MILSSKVTNLYTKVTIFSNFSQPSLYFPYLHSPPPQKKKKRKKKSFPKGKKLCNQSFLLYNDFFHRGYESFQTGKDF